MEVVIATPISTHEVKLNTVFNTPNAATLAAMDASEKGEDIYGPYDSVSELMEALNA